MNYSEDFNNLSLSEVDSWILQQLKVHGFDLFINIYTNFNRNKIHDRNMKTLNYYLYLYITKNECFKGKVSNRFYHYNKNYEITIEKIQDETPDGTQVCHHTLKQIEQKLNKNKVGHEIILGLESFVHDIHTIDDETVAKDSIVAIIKILSLLENNYHNKNSIFETLFSSNCFMEQLELMDEWHDYSNKSLMVQYIDCIDEKTDKCAFICLLKRRWFINWFENFCNHEVKKYRLENINSSSDNNVSYTTLIKISKLLLIACEEQNYQKCEVIPHFLYCNKSHLKISNLSRINEKKAKEFESKHGDSLDHLGWDEVYFSRLFYLTHLMQYNSIYYLYQHMDIQNKAIKTMDVMIASLETNQDLYINETTKILMIEKIQTNKIKMIKQINSYNHELQNIKLNKLIQKFYHFTARWLRANPEEFELLPLPIIKTILKYYTLFPMETIFNPGITEIYRLCQYLLQNNKILNNNYELYSLINEAYLLILNNNKFTVSSDLGNIIHNYHFFRKHKQNIDSFHSQYLILKCIGIQNSRKKKNILSHVESSLLQEMFVDVISNINYLLNEVILDIEYFNKSTESHSKEATKIKVQYLVQNVNFVQYLLLPKVTSHKRIAKLFYEMFVYFYSLTFCDTRDVFVENSSLNNNKILSIKVKYDFNLNAIVYSILKILIKNSDNKHFIQVFREDEQNAEKIRSMHKYCFLLKYDELLILNTFIKNIEQLFDIPEELRDPLTNLLITHPMILPDSGILLDKSTIERHLGSSQSDPYTRTPLTMEDVILHNKKKSTKSKVREFQEKMNQFKINSK